MWCVSHQGGWDSWACVCHALDKWGVQWERGRKNEERKENEITRRIERQEREQRLGRKCSGVLGISHR